MVGVIVLEFVVVIMFVNGFIVLVILFVLWVNDSSVVDIISGSWNNCLSDLLWFFMFLD